MNKIFILILLNFLFSCHKKNELDNIKDTKIDGYSTTWGVSSEKLSVCHQTGKWSIGKERKDWAEAIFECDITDEAIEPYNIKMEEYS
ncbi:MAG: hypothetical protein Q4A74_06400, partial [Cardiobacteriaceae bacterium]|nr:hypothetical protein [Cardiobacteriaceae bacterium]